VRKTTDSLRIAAVTPKDLFMTLAVCGLVMGELERIWKEEIVT
jgi:hypothetical protein